MKKCNTCGSYFSNWEVLFGVFREHNRMCNLVERLQEERDLYRGKLIDANIENARMRRDKETRVDYECPADCGCRQ